MRKIYKINGKTEVHEVFSSPSGKTKIKVTFSKGNLDPKNRVPARFTTDSPIVQAFIENSPKFNKSIFLERVFGDPVKAVVPGVPATAKAASPASPAAPKKGGKAKAADTPKAPELRVMEDVKTIADAATVLTYEGASAADIDGTVEGAIKLAKAFGISFPNLKEE